MATISTSVQGHCMCGAVKVTIDKPAEETVYCHCDNCKRQSGASGTWTTTVDKSAFTLEGTVQDYVDRKTDSGTPMHRYFCGNCGCPIYSFTPLDPDHIVVKMGLFDQVPKVTSEWYCTNKQSWEPSVDGAETLQRSPFQ